MDSTHHKPSLLAQGPAADGSKRILATLEHGASAQRQQRMARRRLDGWMIAVGLLLLMMSALAWQARVSPPGASSRPAVPPQFAETNASPPASLPHTSHAVPAVTENQAAAIVNEAAALTAPGRQTEMVTTTAVAISKAGGRSTTARASATTPRLIPHTATPVARNEAPPAAAAPAQTTAQAQTHERKSTGPSAPVVPSLAADPDVTLLAALVAHANQPATVTAGARNRAMVERGNGDSTESLLRRCRQLGVIEGTPCRSRICSGRWDSDAACRAPSH